MSEGTETVESDYKVEGRGAVTRPNDWIRLESASTCNPLSATGPAVCLYPSLTPALILSCVQVADCAAPSAKCLRGDRAVVRARRDRKPVTTESDCWTRYSIVCHSVSVSVCRKTTDTKYRAILGERTF